MTPEDELQISKEELPQTLPILSLRNTVLFPGVVIPITASRDKSIRLIKDANNFNKLIGVVAQKDESVEDPKLKDIYNIGTVAKIIQLLKLPDGTLKVLVEGIQRAKVNKINFNKDFITASITEINQKTKKNSNIKALQKLIIEQFIEFQKINKKVSQDIINNVKILNGGLPRFFFS